MRAAASCSTHCSATQARIEDLALFVGRGRFVEMWNPRVAAELGGDKLRTIAAFYLKQRGGKA